MFKGQADMEDLVHIINDSLSQWACAYNLFIKLKSTAFGYKKNGQSACQANEVMGEFNKSSLLTSTYQYEVTTWDQNSLGNKLKKYVS